MTRRLAALLLLLLPACADFDGKSFDQVVRGSEVQLVNVLPDGYWIIGEVSAHTENTIDGSPDEYALWCEVDARLERRMRREAARNGGELLVEFACEYYEEEDTSGYYDDPETFYVETLLTCETWCWADVARQLDD